IAVELAVERKTEAEEARLLAIEPPPIDHLDDAIKRTAYIQYIDRFHDQIWSMAKTPLLDGQLSGLRNLASFYLWQGISSLALPAASKLNEQRNQITEKIIAGDKKAAARLMHRHIIGKPQLVYP